VTAERDWDGAFAELTAQFRATTANCMHCLEQIHLIPGMSNCGQPVWEDENGFPACVKGTVRYRGQQDVPGGKFADLDITAPVLHEPMPPGLDGAPA